MVPSYHVNTCFNALSIYPSCASFNLCWLWLSSLLVLSPGFRVSYLFYRIPSFSLWQAHRLPASFRKLDAFLRCTSWAGWVFYFLSFGSGGAEDLASAIAFLFSFVWIWWSNLVLPKSFFFYGGCLWTFPQPVASPFLCRADMFDRYRGG